MRYLIFEKALNLVQAFVLSRFYYCLVNWMFGSKICASLINNVHKRALRVQYMRFDLPLDELLQMSDSLSIHTKHLQFLRIKIYKTLNKLNPSFMWSLFQRNETKYRFQNTSLWLKFDLVFRASLFYFEIQFLMTLKPRILYPNLNAR